MTVETAKLVRLPPDDLNVRGLIRDIRSATARAMKALPGERTDIVRIENLSSQLERLAALHASSTPTDATEVPCLDTDHPFFVDIENLHLAPSVWREAISGSVGRGYVMVELRNPFGAGPTVRKRSGQVTPPQPRWEAPEGMSAKRAAALRFRQQMNATLVASDNAPAFIEPSGVSNTILTETLRMYASMHGDRIDAPVRYQDGSIATPFPLRCLAMPNTVVSPVRELRLAMLSIRHTEMDVEVDGCWFRNFDISRPRPGAETDQLAFETSQAQLKTLARGGPVLIRLYQTGLETAVMGFYRAVVHQLLRVPGSVLVIPMYFRHPPPLPDSAVPNPAVPKQTSYFAEGKPWATT